ncbi:hypothetical protein QE152_g29654 [Popillia japonica]|uniref:Uncharacterized protein n=1 Tax=Popillia japonica TaxID=7064 RepID=A0AAW1JHL2_POPJA
MAVDIYPNMQCDSAGATVNFMCYNIRSLRNKVNLFEIYLKQRCLKFFCLTEHWFPVNAMYTAKIVGYNLISYCSRVQYRGGGCAIYSHSTFPMRSVCCAVVPLEKDFDSTFPMRSVCCAVVPLEKDFVYCCGSYNTARGTFPMRSVCCAVVPLEKDFVYCCGSYNTARGETVIIVCIYRSPLGRFDVFLEKLKVLMDSGDFNVNFNNCDDVGTRDLLSIFSLFNLQKLVQVDTRLSNCIDNIFSNILSKQQKCWVEDPGLSDHNALLCSISMNESEDIVAEERRIYSAEKLTLFLQKLDNETWMQVFNHDGSASSKYDVFYSIFWDYLNSCFPVCKIKWNTRAAITLSAKQ